jgi:hypothetical protein
LYDDYNLSDDGTSFSLKNNSCAIECVECVECGCLDSDDVEANAVDLEDTFVVDSGCSGGHIFKTDDLIINTRAPLPNSSITGATMEQAQFLQKLEHFLPGSTKHLESELYLHCIRMVNMVPIPTQVPRLLTNL